MREKHSDEDDLIAVQRDVFRLAERDHKLTAKRLGALTRISHYTIASWAHGTAMPAWALVVLSRHIPDDLLSLLFESAGKSVTSLSSDNSDLDDLSREAAGFVAEKLDAESDGKVIPIEHRRLKERARKLAAKATRVALA